MDSIENMVLQTTKEATEVLAEAKVNDIAIAIVYHKDGDTVTDIACSAERITPATEDSPETRAYIGHGRKEADGAKTYHVACGQCAVELTTIFKKVFQLIEAKEV